jgi:aminoglycoside 3-N-acetyltransferase
MNETEIIAQTPEPRTRQTLAVDLRQLGVEPGMILLVHSSLSSLGWVNGGPVAVIQALLDVLTPTGTLIMPTHSSGLSDPALWENPPVPKKWWATIRETMPAFEPALTPALGMGRIAEVFRTMPEALRSYHPAVSFTALGPRAEAITDNHQLEYPLGNDSPLGRIYDLGGWVLLMGVDYGSNTSFHLAEYRVLDPPLEQLGAPLIIAGKRTWITYQDVKLDESPFVQIGAAFESGQEVITGAVGSATGRLFRQREAVDFAIGWLESRQPRPAPPSVPPVVNK